MRSIDIVEGKSAKPKPARRYQKRRIVISSVVEKFLAISSEQAAAAALQKQIDKTAHSNFRKNSCQNSRIRALIPSFSKGEIQYHDPI
jgi:hypothetical protein